MGRRRGGEEPAACHQSRSAIALTGWAEIEALQVGAFLSFCAGGWYGAVDQLQGRSSWPLSFRPENDEPFPEGLPCYPPPPQHTHNNQHTKQRQ